jgi:hypothetical protein
MSDTIVILVIGASQALTACTQPPAPTARVAPSAARLTGKLVEKFDHPPYSYLRLKTEAGQAWVAVPVGFVDPEKPVTVVNGVAVKNYSVGSGGRRFEVITFGVVEPGPVTR